MQMVVQETPFPRVVVKKTVVAQMDVIIILMKDSQTLLRDYPAGAKDGEV